MRICVQEGGGGMKCSSKACLLKAPCFEAACMFGTSKVVLAEPATETMGNKASCTALSDVCCIEAIIVCVRQELGLVGKICVCCIEATFG